MENRDGEPLATKADFEACCQRIIAAIEGHMAKFQNIDPKKLLADYRLGKIDINGRPLEAAK